MTVRQNLILNFLIASVTIVFLLVLMQQQKNKTVEEEQSVFENAEIAVPEVTVPQTAETSFEICDFNNRELFFKVRDLEKARQEQEAKRLKEAEEQKKKQEQEAARLKQEQEKARLEKEKQEKEAKAKQDKERLEKEKAEAEQNRIVPQKAYPETWPRLKMTGSYVMAGGIKKVIITGGKTLTISTNDQDSCHFIEGQEVGSGVYVKEIRDKEVVLLKDKETWTIKLGAEPPAVKKK